MSNIKDITFQRFSRLIAIHYAGRHRFPSGKTAAKWRCRCDCGYILEVFSGNLVNGATKSCGCLRTERTKKANTKHGATAGGKITPEFQSWSHMLSRCYNRKSDSFKYYGGRGISVCSRWKNSFKNFLSDMGPRQSIKHSIDRKDNNGNYEPNNCRWATQQEQCNNQRNNRVVILNGKFFTMAQLSRLCGLKSATIRCRINSGLTPEEAMSKPLRGKSCQ